MDSYGALALLLNEQAVDIRRRLLGEKHPDAARSLNRIALLHNRLGSMNAARETIETTMAFWRGLSETENLDYAGCLLTASQIHMVSEENNKAVELLESALEIHDKCQVMRTFETARVLHYLEKARSAIHDPDCTPVFGVREEKKLRLGGEEGSDTGFEVELNLEVPQYHPMRMIIR